MLYKLEHDNDMDIEIVISLVNTIFSVIPNRCVGQAASMGSLLLAAGEPGMRHSLPNSRIMIHQPSGGAQVGLEL